MKNVPQRPAEGPSTLSRNDGNAMLAEVPVLQVIGDASNVILHLNDLIHKMAFGGNESLKRLAYLNAVDYFEKLGRHFG